MGVSATIVVEADSRESALRGAAGAYERMAEIEQVASDYRPGSELMRLCREAAVGEWRPVSRDLAELLTVARDVSERTDGAFDVTVGPAVKLWREARGTGRLPDQSKVIAARERIDWRAVEVQRSPPRARLLKASMALDMGGIAKGYAAREAGRVLEGLGLNRCLVALAGDVYAGAPPSDRGGEGGWRIQVRSDQSERVVGTLVVAHGCVSTSGDTEQFVEFDGKRYSYIVDPRTGLGVVGGAVVTAIGGDGVYVDSAATAASVLGAEHLGGRLVQGRGVTFIVHHGSAPPEIIGDTGRVRWRD